MSSLSSEGKALLDDKIARACHESKIPSVVFGVSSMTEELYFGAAGLRDLGKPSSGNVDESSVLWVCSMTKLVTTIAILQLVEQKRISLDAVVSEIIPELKDPVVLNDPFAEEPTFKPAKTKITLAHLLNHSSGLFVREKHDPPYALPTLLTGDYGPTDPVGLFYARNREKFPAIPLKFEPGSDFSYGQSTCTIGFIIEKISGQSLEEYCQMHIFKPLGIRATFYLTPDYKARSVAFSFREPSGEFVSWASQVPVIEQDPKKVHLILGGLGMYTSLQDYLSLCRHLLQIRAGFAENPILSVDSVLSLFKSTLNETAARSVEKFTPGWKDCQWSTGLCLNNTDWPGRRRKGSAFWYGWGGTYFFIDPTTGISAMLGTQIVPTCDADVLRLWEQLEEIVYSHLVVDN
ncbi:uncharacterized protein LACBIDRAFT_317165 [Laccaria bicolor S238N-H82]|uniref:Predicted protein n=1 Tax=Laccaria bicolor (strain S238N-H82 / ATCC MYA-4686) TaxID=486041 RepID=B0D4J1_LACBS|nr:uncharacterized protein LACBIDRAFT_317165 [Laccaria bicolor S238N-H82]EDR10572.1 predicted protein [Laccaria bicolor S238N-H82]|eukprot:XP_001879022.1 predicted protein [Laccaria bicolor S238N-H82]